MFQLDDNHEQMLSTISNKVQTTSKLVGMPEVGELFSPERDLTKVYSVVKLEDDKIVLRERGLDDDTADIRIEQKALSTKWIQIQQIEKPAEVVATAEQKIL